MPLTAPTLQYTSADITILSNIFSDDLESFINWRPEWAPAKEKWLKRPTQSISNPLAHLSLAKAASYSQLIGLVCNDLHNIIAIDIDGVDPATPALAQLLQSHPTYIEQSPSGKPNHLRVLYEVDDKDQLKRKSSLIPEGQPNSQQSAIELFSTSTNFVTLTGKAISPIHSITKISADTIISHFPSFAPTRVIDIKTREPLPTVTQLVPAQVWTTEVPCDRDDPQLITFLGKHSLVYYNYWLLGIMAIHAAYGQIQGYSVAETWSQQSAEFDQEELLAKWETISDPTYEVDVTALPQQQTSVTAATYQWMFSEFSIQWPVLKGKSKVPKPDELVNFKAFLKYKGLAPVKDELTRIMFLAGEDYAVYPKYYSSKEAAYAVKADNKHALAARLVDSAEPYNFRPTTNLVKGWLSDLVLLSDDIKINRFALEISSQPQYDPKTEPNYLKIMSTDIIQRNSRVEAPSQEFHDLLVYKWLLSLGRNMWPELRHTATSEGVLILSSPKAGIGKSSFGQRLFPREWRHLHVTTKPKLSGQFADKDSVMKTIGKVVVDFDEAERIFNKNDPSDLKSYLTEEYDVYRPPYETDVDTCKRYFSCMASTNEINLVFPKDGVRRYWWLNVDYVDTYAMDDMNMYNLWRQIYHELKVHTGKRAPYILTTAEIAYLTTYLCDHRTTTEADEILMDIFDFTDDGFAKYLKKGRKVGFKKWSMKIGEINSELVKHGINMKMKPIKHSVLSLLKQHAPDFYISNQLVKDGVFLLGRQYRYFMPTLSQDPLRRAAEDDLD